MYSSGYIIHYFCIIILMHCTLCSGKDISFSLLYLELSPQLNTGRITGGHERKDSPLQVP